jgi:dTDP-4-dehydrorhamnose reductase
MKKVAIIGASGTLGAPLMRDFSRDFEVVGTYHFHKKEGLINLDVTNRMDVKRFIEDANPDLVILASAMTNVEGCELNPGLAKEINVGGTRNILEQNPRMFVFFSTDAIFDGRKQEYFEIDTPNPVNVYGTTKLEAEELARTAPNHLILRTSRFYGLKCSKFVNKLIFDLSEGKEISVPRNTCGSMSFVEDVSRATLDLVSMGARGTYHVVGDAYSLEEVAYQISRVFGFEKSLINVVGSDFFDTHVKRPNVVLNANKLNSLGIRIRSLEEGLIQIKEHYQNGR